MVLLVIPSNVLMLIGNGLSMDLRQTFRSELEAWHTACPLSWDLEHPELGLPLRKLFPVAFKALAKYPGNDFDRMTALLDVEGSMEGHPVVELRHYLVMAFSLFQREVDRLPLQNWRWWKFFHENSHRISTIVSFNYDLVAERTASRAGIRPITLGMPEPLPMPFDGFRHRTSYLWKPHGSVDYRPGKGGIVIPATYPLMNWVVDNNVQLEWCPPDEWTLPRIEADVVVPTEVSRYRHFQWVVPGERWVRRNGKAWDTCVIVGISYAACDREEIDIVLNSLPSTAEVFVVDPSPSGALLQQLEQLKLSVTCTQEPPNLGAG